MLFKQVEFPQVQYIDLSDIVHVVKAVIIVQCALKLINSSLKSVKSWVLRLLPEQSGGYNPQHAKKVMSKTQS